MRALRSLSRRRFLAALLAPFGVAAAGGRRAGAVELAATDTLPAPGRAPRRAWQLSFLVGANYEGPPDRAWTMWRYDRFDPGLIEADFARAARFGLRCLRLFVQGPLALEIRRRRWDRLDTVLELAERHRLLVLLTLGDYDEPRLAVLGNEAGAVAGHCAGRAAVLGYDLRNEPQFADVLVARYPPDVSVALQGRTLLDTYGQRMSPAEVAERRGDPLWLPAQLSAEVAYWYANSLALYEELWTEAGGWIASSPGWTILDYLAQPEPGERWAPLLRLTDEALRTWLTALASPIRRVDPARPLTVGYNDLLLASLPANAALDFISLHHYPPADDAAPTHSARVLSQLADRLGQPAMLGEFGWTTGEHPPDRVAALEVATLRELRRRGLGGGLKWMLNDAIRYPDAGEDTFGLFRVDGTPKPSANALLQFVQALDAGSGDA